VRFDCFAIQDLEPRDGRYGYNKQLSNWKGNRWIIKYHVAGKRTVGFYQISLEDTVKWICFDFDDHKGERGEAVRTEVCRLLSILDKYKIPFLLEASGSPNSYHVWILLKPVKTCYAHRFAIQIKSEAGVDCEIYPRQKGLNKNSKFGNLVKVPLGINRKNGVKSQFLDQTTFEPYPGIIPIPGIVCLREMVEPEETAERISQEEETIQTQENSIPAPTRLGCDLRPCFQGILYAKTPMEGSEGHTMRLAIAAEARNIGLSIEETIKLFKNQLDFNEGITRRYVEDVYNRGYHPFSCEKLTEQCKSLVQPYCAGCSFGN